MKDILRSFYWRGSFFADGQCKFPAREPTGTARALRAGRPEPYMRARAARRATARGSRSPRRLQQPRRSAVLL